MSVLYVVATPIGNLGDITLRALDVLRDADIIICEDTRVTRKLLSHYSIQKSLISYHEHSGPHVYAKIAEFLRTNKKAALVSDAGTPGISDPGARLVRFLREEIKDISIIPIPGPSALIAAASVSGMNMDQFVFLGFPPHKKGRKKFFNAVRNNHFPVIIYESTHRIERALQELGEILENRKEIIVARELTKMYEEIWKGTIHDAQTYFQEKHKKGEFVIIIP